MRTLYIECKMGAAGDMLMAALYELLDEAKKAEFTQTMNTIFGEDVHIHAKDASKCGIYGTHISVHALGVEEGHHEHEHHHDHEHEHHHDHDHEHHHHGHTHSHEHYSYESVCHKIEHLNIDSDVIDHACAVYRLIGEAEAKAHNSTLSNIHFHEVGSLDAMADVVGCCLLISYLNPDQIIASPIHVGNGTVKCAHGVLPVPAPATAEILKGVPYYTGDIDSELCTPTGAAILKHFVSEYKAMPIMTIEKTGIGLGNKEFDVANMVRIFSGELVLEPSKDVDDMILDLSCNIDDMTGEDMGFALDMLINSGALDVFYIPIQMKKNRPGILLHCYCHPADEKRFEDLIFKHTTTRGIRIAKFDRLKLNSTFEEIRTEYGTVHNKVSCGYGVSHSKLEFEDIKKIAFEHNLSLTEVRDIIAKSRP